MAVADLLVRPGVIEHASPGFYFQRCLEIWRSDLRETIKEKAPALLALQKPPRGLPGQRSDEAAAQRLVQGDVDLLDALVARQAATFEALRSSAVGALVLRLRSISPFVTGIGQAHPLETGFAFLKPYGIPYLAGSGTKGAVKAACSADWEVRCPERRAELLLHYFGSDDREPERRRGGDRGDHRRGALVFLDLFPERPAPDGAEWRWSDAFRADIVNPHYGEYYQGKAAPADWLQPKPSNFLTLRAKLRWTLHVVYAPLSGEARSDWERDVRPGLEAALTACGLGAKKSWGYGLFEILADGRADGSSLALSVGASAAPVADASPAARAPGRAPAGGPSARTQAIEHAIRALRSNEVKGRASQLERDLSACTAEEREALLAVLEARLRAFRWKPKDMSEVMDRLRRAGGPAEA